MDCNCRSCTRVAVRPDLHLTACLWYACAIACPSWRPNAPGREG